MIKHFLLSFCTLCVFSAGAQNFEWAKQYTNDFYRNMTVSPRGEIFVTGNKILAAQLNADGTPKWQLKFPSGYLNGQDIKMDNDSNLFVAGTFNGTNQVGDTTLKATIGEGFIAKLDKQGNIDWIRQTTAGNAGISKLDLDAEGNAIVSGYFSGSDISFGNNVIYNNGKDDGFMAKVRPNGSVEWIYSVSTTGDDGIFDFNILPDGNILITGFYNGEGGIGVDNVPAFDTKAGFSAVFNPANGKITSIQADTTLFYQNIIRKGSSYYFTASFTGQLIIAGDTFNNPSSIEKDGLLIQTDDLLQPVWATHFTGGVPSSFGLNSDGSIVIGGGFNKKLTINSQNIFANKGEADMFFATYDNTGSLLWAMHPSGPNIDEVYRIYTDTIHNNYYIIGSIQSGPVKFGNINVEGDFSGAPFIAKSGTITTGIVENKSAPDTQIRIYPNPASEVINVQLPLQNTFENCVINIFSLSGQNIYKGKTRSGLTQLDIQDLKPGMYIFQLTGTDKVYNQLISITGK